MNTQTTLIVPTADAPDRLPALVRSYLRTVGASAELMILRHYRGDARAETTSTYDRIVAEAAALSTSIYVLPYHGPFNYSRMMNFAVSRLRTPTPYVCLVNDDVILASEHWLAAMESRLAERPEFAIVGCKLLYPDDPSTPIAQLCDEPTRHYGKIQHAGVQIVQQKGSTHVYRNFHYDHPLTTSDRLVDAVTFAVVLLRRSLFNGIRFDEHLCHDYNDIDFCLQASALGQDILYCAAAIHFHLETLTRRITGEHNNPDNKERFMAKWRERIARAPNLMASVSNGAGGQRHA